MRILAYTLMLCCCAAATATGGDSREMNRGRLIICSQFVIEEPGPTTVGESPQHCCRFANRIHDCHFVEWDDQDS